MATEETLGLIISNAKKEPCNLPVTLGGPKMSLHSISNLYMENC